MESRPSGRLRSALATLTVVALVGVATASATSASPPDTIGGGRPAEGVSQQGGHDNGGGNPGGAGNPGGGGIAVAPSSEPGTPAGHNPPGNNGTFKVDGPEYDDGKGNEPHVTCSFRLVFYGFDNGQRGSINIDGHAPTGSGRVATRSDVLLSDDDAGGGKDRDAVFVFTPADLDLTGQTPHPKQGYHLKVTVLTGEPGGKKHKMFWLEPCPPATAAPPTPPAPLVAPTPTPTVTPSVTPTLAPSVTPTVTPNMTAGTTAAVSAAASAAANAAAATPKATPVPAAAASVAATAASSTGVAGVSETRPGAAAQPDTAVLGVKVTRPEAAAQVGGVTAARDAVAAGRLPFTGTTAADLLAVALVLLGAGAAAVVSTRRRRTSSSNG